MPQPALRGVYDMAWAASIQGTYSHAARPLVPTTNRRPGVTTLVSVPRSRIFRRLHGANLLRLLRAKETLILLTVPPLRGSLKATEFPHVRNELTWGQATWSYNFGCPRSRSQTTSWREATSLFSRQGTPTFLSPLNYYSKQLPYCYRSGERTFGPQVLHTSRPKGPTRCRTTLSHLLRLRRGRCDG